MNIHEYISSGIVESYVLGLADPGESAEFERMCAAHPEVRRARDEFEMALEKEAIAHALRPSNQIKSKIFSELDVEADRAGSRNSRAPVYTIDKPNPNVSRPANVSWQRYLAAASVVLLLGSTALNLYFFTQYRRYSTKYTELLAQQNNLASSNQVLQTRLQQHEQVLELLRNPGTRMIRATGSDAPASPHPAGMATIFWDSASSDVHLMVNNLPVATGTKQYQLWAIVDGKPLDAGVFDMSPGVTLIRMKNVPRAEVFAITLEKKGGVPAPEGPIYVLGKV